jgi:hypothetical protein
MKQKTCPVGRWESEEQFNFSWRLFFKCIAYPMSIVGFISTIGAVRGNRNEAWGFFLACLLASAFVGLIVGLINGPITFKRVWVEK